VGEPVITTTSTLSATQSLIQSLTSTPPNRFPFSRQGPRQLVRQRRRQDNQCRTVSHLTHILNTLPASPQPTLSFLTYAGYGAMAYFLFLWYTMCLMCSGGNKLLRSPLYGFSKTWEVIGGYIKSRKKEKKGGRCTRCLDGRYNAAKQRPSDYPPTPISHTHWLVLLTQGKVWQILGCYPHRNSVSHVRQTFPYPLHIIRYSLATEWLACKYSADYCSKL